MSNSDSVAIKPKALPTAGNERVIALDVIRGIALFGILVVNMMGYAWPQLYLTNIATFWESSTDQFAFGIISFLFQGKFFTMFSLLFGIGFVIFMDRVQMRGLNPAPVFTRRMLALLGFGIIHGFFIWWGDILLTYAIGGLLLLVFYRREQKTLITWAITLPVLYLLLVAMSIGLMMFAEQTQQGLIEAQTTATGISDLASYQSSMEAYGKGSWSETHTQRIKDTSLMAANIPFVLMQVLPMFLLGVYVYRKGVLHDLLGHMGWIKRLFVITAPIGLLLNITYVWFMYERGSNIYSWQYVIENSALVIGGIFLCIAYVTGILLLLQKSLWQRLLQPFAYAGRMALTNYISQSLICTFIFYHFGFSQYGKWGPALGIAFAIGLFAIQVIVSNLWFRKWRWGPLEALWRLLTYGRLQPAKSTKPSQG